MAEIHPDQYQNGDMHKGFKIKRNVTLYLTNSYAMAMFLCIRMFNPFATFLVNPARIPESAVFIMILGVVPSSN